MITFLTYSLVALAVFAALVFIYEAIILPSFRLNLRFQLFSLRDRLRNLKSELGHGLNNAAFHALDDSLSRQMERQHRYSAVTLYDADKLYREDESFKRSVDQDLEVFEHCQLPEFIEIRNQAANLFCYTLLANSGVLVVLLLPVILIVVGRSWFKMMISRLAFSKAQQIDRVESCHAAIAG